MNIFAVDPGPMFSAWVEYSPEYRNVTRSGYEDNEKIMIRIGCLSPEITVAVEEVACYGMPVGKEVFDTVRFTGRIEQLCAGRFLKFILVPRSEVKMHLCQSMRAKDSNIRQSLLDKFGGKSAVGTKKSPGPLYGISSHKWSALAIAVTASERIE